MRKSFSLLLLSFFALSSCTTSPDRVTLAHVNQEKITAGDLKKIFAEQRDQYGNDLLIDPEGSLTIKKKILNGMIEERLLLQVVQEKNIFLSPEEEKALLDRLQSGYSEGELQRSLNKRKTSLDQWLDEQEKKRLIEKLIDQEIYSQIHPTRKEIEDTYRKFRTKFQRPDQIHCRHIVTNREDKARTLLSLLKKGEPFAAVAKQYSESPDRENGGDLGFISRGDYSGIFEEACFTLSTGQTSEVVPSVYGYHIFNVTEKRPGRQLSLQEASPLIESRLREEKGHRTLRDWLENLHRNKKIVIDEKALKEVSLNVP